MRKNQAQRELAGIGSRIKAVRTRAGLKQGDFAERLGYVQSYVSDIENGKKRPSGKFLSSLSEKFGVDPIAISSGQGAQFTGRQGRGARAQRSHAEANKAGQKIATLNQGAQLGPRFEAQTVLPLVPVSDLRLAQTLAALAAQWEAGDARQRDNIIARLRQAFPDLNTEEARKALAFLGPNTLPPARAPQPGQNLRPARARPLPPAPAPQPRPKRGSDK